MLITGLHATTGFSWVVTLPLTALIVRVIFIAPITTYAHSVSQRRLQNRSILEAWANVYRKKIMEKHAAAGPRACQKLFAKEFSHKSAEIYKRTGTQRWKSFLPYLQLPVWLTVIETIRRMCGTTGGLLGIIQDSLNKSLSNITPVDNTENTSEPGPLESVVDNLQSAPSEVMTGPGDRFEISVVPIEPSLATGGALWFPDLLISDPHLILPFILSATMFTSISYQEHTAKKRGLTPGAFQRRLGNALKIVALAVGPLTLAVPSAIHVYWISSSTLTLGNNFLLNWYSSTAQSQRPKKSERGDQESSIMWESEARQIQSILERRQQKKGHTDLPSQMKSPQPKT
ncbi:MAG: hypothetical protein Q9216_004042 [Gyalolechia sp. 2 TL-2023]